jgi:hypothetical protein
MTVNKKFTRQDVALAFEAIGGWKGLVRFAKKNDRNRETFYQMFKKEIADGLLGEQPHAENDSQELAAKLSREFMHLRDARQQQERDDEVRTGMRIIDGVEYVRRNSNLETADRGVTDDVAQNVPNSGTKRATKPHGLQHTASGVSGAADPPKPPSKPIDDGITKPSRPDVTPHADTRNKPAPIVGLFAASALGEGSQSEDMYGRTFSQTIMPRGW